MKVKYLLLLAVSGSVISLDQLTKQLILKYFYLGESIPIIKGFISLCYVRNPGAAFGMLARADAAFRIPFFIIVPIIALFVVGFLFKKIEDQDYRMASALSLVIGGAIGNLIDRVSYNYVIDFLDFHWGMTGPHFPAFNVADSAITIGVGILILDMILKERAAKRNVSSAH